MIVPVQGVPADDVLSATSAIIVRFEASLGPSQPNQAGFTSSGAELDQCFGGFDKAQQVRSHSDCVRRFLAGLTNGIRFGELSSRSTRLL